MVNHFQVRCDFANRYTLLAVEIFGISNVHLDLELYQRYRRDSIDRGSNDKMIIQFKMIRIYILSIVIVVELTRII